MIIVGKKNDVVQFTERSPYLGCFAQIVQVDFSTTNDFKYKVLLRSPLPFDQQDYIWVGEDEIEIVGIAPYMIKE